MVECGGLEKRSTARYRGFESLLLCNQKACVMRSISGLFSFRSANLACKGVKEKSPQATERSTGFLVDNPPNGITQVIPITFFVKPLFSFYIKVLESVMKNCGTTIHCEVATKEFMEFFKDLVKVLYSFIF